MSLLRDYLAELRRLNANLEALVDVLRDLRTMWADVAGWRVRE